MTRAYFKTKMIGMLLQSLNNRSYQITNIQFSLQYVFSPGSSDTNDKRCPGSGKFEPKFSGM